MDIENKIAGFIKTNKEKIANNVVSIHYKMDLEILQKYKEEGYKKSIEDTIFTLSVLSKSIDLNSPILFIDYIAWLKSVLKNIGISESIVINNLFLIKNEFDKLLPEDSEFISNQFLIPASNIINVDKDFDLYSYFESNSIYNDIAQHYFNLLIKNDQKGAYELIIRTLKNGMSVKDVYIHIFQPCLKETGRLWQLNKITIAQEHYFTSFTFRLMSKIYPYIYTKSKSNLRFLGFCVGGELHEIGIKMVSDFLEMEGFETFLLGANVPSLSVIKAIKEFQTNIVGISTSNILNIYLVQEIIKLIHSDPDLRHVKILVGGYPFNIDKELWNKVEADGYSPNASEVIDVIHSLFY